MPLRQKVFAFIAVLQLAGALCITIPGKPTPLVVKVRTLCHRLQEPSATAMESVGKALGFMHPVANEHAPWPPALTLTVLPLNILIWGMVLHFLSERVDLAPRNSTGAPHLRQ